ncbi:hypothetical protein G9X64_28965 [Rhizobium sophorae]|uniref:Uncharacterized protein n=1 Tax=Rhizobium sophorae TaxID=1535242 RepID=A0A7Y3SC61_9HYPH|nr:hypothetical protein [Rhizobium sophorae]MBX4863056.1 hypothetical protein [Rhizobium bangladeshense]NNU40445.1 hypothetical protein [Rhizobium sophorae]
MKIDGGSLRQRNAPPADYSVDTAGGEYQVADLCAFQKPVELTYNRLHSAISLRGYAF